MRYLVIILLLASMHSPAQAGFKDGYLSPQDMYITLDKKFDGLVVDSTSCRVLMNPNRSGLGDSSPFTGEVAVSLPDTAFLSWYQGCLDSYFNYLQYHVAGTQNSKATAIWKKMIPSLASKIDEAVASGKPPQEFVQTFATSGLSPETQKQIVRELTEWALGTDEEILSYGLISDMDQFRDDLLKHVTAELGTTSLGIFSKSILQILLKRDEFLLY